MADEKEIFLTLFSLQTSQRPNIDPSPSGNDRGRMGHARLRRRKGADASGRGGRCFQCGELVWCGLVLCGVVWCGVFFLVWFFALTEQALF